jgi:outer membrane protein assembly factor BamA
LLKNFLALPEALQEANASVELALPINFEKMIPLQARAKVRSNIANIDAEIAYDKNVSIETKMIVPKDSLLRSYKKKLNFDALSPLKLDLSLAGKNLHIEALSKGVRSKVMFNTENKDLEGEIVLAGSTFTVKGNVKKNLYMKNSVDSLQNLLKKVNTIYAFKIPPLYGDIKVSMVIKEMKKLDLDLRSNRLIYKVDENTAHTFKDTVVSLGYANSILTLNNYRTSFKKENIFSTKPSEFKFKEGKIELSPLWINNELKVTGMYDIEHKQGEILAYADPLNIAHKLIDMRNLVNVKGSFEQGKTSIEGTIVIKDGDIHYDLDSKSFDSDHDIIVLQERKKKKTSPFMRNLRATLNISSENALLYQTTNADVKIKVDLLLQKEADHNASLFGQAEILKGSAFRIKGKKFIFIKSILYFTGDPLEAILDIAAVYHSVQADISIQVTGTSAAPQVILSSIPYMTYDEILSAILLGAQSKSGLGKKDGDMSDSILSHANGGMLSSVFSTVGVNIARLPFIGKSDDINLSKKAIVSFFNSEDENSVAKHEIDFIGEKYIKKTQLQKAMGVKTTSIFQFWKKRRATISDKHLGTLEGSLQKYYRTQGFYDAKFTIQRSKTRVLVQVNENMPVRVTHINVQSDFDIDNLLTFKKGDIFNDKAFATLKHDIIKRMLKEGYCSYDLNSKAYVDTFKHEVKLDIILKKGGLCTFGKVSVKPFKTIDDDVILSRVRIHEGDRFSTDRIRESYDALYGLGAFDAVYVKYDRKFYNVVPVVIEGKEISKPWYFKSGLGYDTTIGFSLSADAIRTNYKGNAKQLGLHVSYSEVEKWVEGKYFIPALFSLAGHYIDSTSMLGYSEFEYSGFREEKEYLHSYVAYNNEKLNLYAGFGLEDVTVSPFGEDATFSNIARGNFVLAGPYLGFKYDNRAVTLDKEFGFYIEGKAEYAMPYNEKASSYLKYMLEGGATYTFSELILTAVGKTGTVDTLQNRTPESKLFFEGGINSNRAYGYKRVGVVNSPTSYGFAGGSTMANLTLEANYPLGDKFYAAVFTDNTMLANERFHYNGNVLSSAGLGISYLTPMGPFRVNFGMNVHDTSQHAIHFKVGHAF